MKGGVVAIFEEGRRKTDPVKKNKKDFPALSSSSHIAISVFSLKHASFPALRARETHSTGLEVQRFHETVHTMQSQISILRDKPTMYLNVLLLLNN